MPLGKGEANERGFLHKKEKRKEESRIQGGKRRKRKNFQRCKVGIGRERFDLQPLGTISSRGRESSESRNESVTRRVE